MKLTCINLSVDAQSPYCLLYRYICMQYTTLLMICIFSHYVCMLAYLVDYAFEEEILYVHHDVNRRNSVFDSD
jgi:hypothetical protein